MANTRGIHCLKFANITDPLHVRGNTPGKHNYSLTDWFCTVLHPIFVIPSFCTFTLVEVINFTSKKIVIFWGIPYYDRCLKGNPRSYYIASKEFLKLIPSKKYLESEDCYSSGKEHHDNLTRITKEQCSHAMVPMLLRRLSHLIFFRYSLWVTVWNILLSSYQVEVLPQQSSYAKVIYYYYLLIARY